MHDLYAVTQSPIGTPWIIHQSRVGATITEYRLKNAIQFWGTREECEYYVTSRTGTVHLHFKPPGTLTTCNLNPSPAP